MHIRTKIITSFIIISLVMGLAITLVGLQVKAIDDKKNIIHNIELLSESILSHYLLFIQGHTQYREIAEKTNDEIENELKSLLEKSDTEERKIIAKLQESNNRIHDLMLDKNSQESIASQMDKRDKAFEDFITRNNLHIIRITEYKQNWGDFAPSGILDNTLYNIDRERTLLLTFDPIDDNWPEIRDEFRTTNDFVVSNLVSLLVDELDFHISAIKSDDPELQKIKDSLVSQRDIARKITATSFPAITDEQSKLSKLPVSSVLTGDAVIETTVSLGKKCEENIIGLENASIPVRKRHNVKEVGDNKNSIQVLISVIKCQQELRINAEDFMASKLAIQERLDTDFPEHDYLLNSGLEQLLDNSEEKNIATLYLIVFVPLIGGIIAFGSFFSISLTKPLHKLQNATKQVTKGNLDVVVKPEGTEEVRDLIQTFNEMIGKRKKMDMEKDDFLSMISHELNTPLVPILGNLEMLMEQDMLGKINKDQLKALRDIQNNVERLQVHLNDLTILNKLISNKLDLKKENIQIKDLLDEVKKYFEPTTSAKNTTIINSTKNASIISYKKELKIIFFQLIRNSLTHIPSEGGRIEINAEDRESDVLFYVKDNGSGIPEKKQKYLFRKFYQIDTSPTREHQGLGLGLAICKGIVELMRGKIWIESEGKGTTVYFNIPKN